MNTANKALTFFALAALASACQQTAPTESEAYKQLLQDHERTLAEVAQKDSAMTLVLSTFSRVGDNLRAIRTKEGELVGPPPGAETGDLEESMMADIQRIDALLAENKRMIARLRKEAKGSAEKIAELETAIASLEQQVAEKDTEITTMKQRLSATNRALRHYIDLYQDKTKQAALLETELNTAYYVVGSSKDLREKGVLTKEGGIVGIGSTDKLKTEGLNKESFTRIDLSTAEEIPIGAKKARLATPHPEGSYTLVDGANKLVIDDPEAFWSLSKHLVVVVVK